MKAADCSDLRLLCPEKSQIFQSVFLSFKIIIIIMDLNYLVQISLLRIQIRQNHLKTYDNLNKHIGGTSNS